MFSRASDTVKGREELGLPDPVPPRIFFRRPVLSNRTAPLPILAPRRAGVPPFWHFDIGKGRIWFALTAWE
jgi:hypothetical protein